jgi:threo-3-hydroxy-L-aspartate ammonia-lyase
VLTLDDVVTAGRRIDGIAHRTPLFFSRTLNQRCGGLVVAKAENLQRTGSFKIRGAYNRISHLTDSERARGVVAYSSGNHAQAVALAASIVGTPAIIVMPSDAPTIKREATEAYGAEVVTYDRRREDRETIAKAMASDRGMTLVPPYDDPMVIAGQGTVALELIQDAGEFDLLFVPVGGGGLSAGCALAATGMVPGIRVIGVEPELADDTRRSFEAGTRVRIEPPATVADGLMVQTPGRVTFEFNRRLLARIVTVTEAEIVGAMAFLAERMKLVTEPSGAVAAAALLARKVDCEGQRVGVVLSGGNIAIERFAALVSTGD